MPPSDRTRARPSSVDWRGWLALAWVVYFGILYGKMVVERRGEKLRAAVPGLAARPRLVPDHARPRPRALQRTTKM